MNKIFSILFLIASLAQAQTTLLCEDNFTSPTVTGCNLSAQYSERTNGVFTFQIVSLNSGPVYPVGVSFASDISEYDTLKLEMDLKINTPNAISYNFNQITIQNNINNSIFFDYTDATNNKSYTGAMFENPYLPFFIYLPNTINNYVSNKLISKEVKPTGFSFSFMTFQPSPLSHTFSNSTWGQINPMMIGNYSMNIFEDQGFLTKIKQAFCVTTGNPGDCLAKVSVSPPPVMPVFFEIDNFKAYGIKKLITGLEEKITTLQTRTLVGMYNTLGQKLDPEQTHDGVVIKMYSDGTKEKVIISNK